MRLNRLTSVCAALLTIIVALFLPVQANGQAQTVSPVTVAPATLVPDQPARSLQVAIPEAGKIAAPAGADHLSVVLDNVNVEGAFAEVSSAVQMIVDGLKGRQVTLAQIYDAAAAVEKAHAHAGYILARVSVPPQKLQDGGVLTIQVVDGFIESVNVSQLAQRVKAPVRARTRALIGRHHVRLQDIEQALLITANTPGLELRSTLARGEKPGGTRLVLEGRQRLLTGQISMENSLAPSLGRWASTVQLALNSPFGAGEQLYMFASGDYRFKKWLSRQPRDRVLGGGVLLPLDDGRVSVNAEGVFARTSPDVVANAPETSGTFRRLALRGSLVLAQNRQHQSAASLAVEQIDDRNSLPSFSGVKLHQDRYMAARLGWTWSDTSSSRTRYGLSAQFSQGLGGLGAITVAEARASAVPFSRLNANTKFTKIAVNVQTATSLDADTDIVLRARAQSSFGSALFRAEQFALEGTDGLSAYVGGRSAVDEGFVVRAEGSRRFRVETDRGAKPLNIAPYIFAGAGVGRINAHVQPERRHVGAVNIGAGARVQVPGGVRLTAEYARGFSSYWRLEKADRVNLGVSISF